ncbi:uncharacterized protein [Halyomorpha halys]|uniref:uncharacterized protein n=1 Tax=Halyomorpha halys TaxID=286706 RepID=UPI0006D50850|nr:uncharacterized protein LOC106677615 [Halyomorpha halys]
MSNKFRYTESKKDNRFHILVKPALQNKSGFFSAKLFDSEGTTRWQKNKYYNQEIVLKLSVVKDGGIQWTACVFIPAKLQHEALILRRSNICGQKLWIPVRPSSSGLSKWSELIVPKMVGNKPVWVSAEGIVGYLRPVKIFGVQVWLPTPTKEMENEEICHKRPSRKQAQACKLESKTSRCKKITYSLVHLKSGHVIVEKKPNLVVLDLPDGSSSKRKQNPERAQCRKALEKITRKLVEKADSVYPQVDLDSSSGSELDMDDTPEQRDEDEQEKRKEASRLPRDRKFYGIWGEAEVTSKNFRQDSMEGRQITSFFLPDQDVPVITAIGPSKDSTDPSTRRP